MDLPSARTAFMATVWLDSWDNRLKVSMTFMSGLLMFRRANANGTAFLEWSLHT